MSPLENDLVATKYRPRVELYLTPAGNRGPHCQRRPNFRAGLCRRGTATCDSANFLRL